MARILIRSDDDTTTVELTRADPDDDAEQSWIGRCDSCTWTLTERAAQHTADTLDEAETHVDQQH